jgi:hypothetical protein
VLNTETLAHFEAVDEAEAQDTINAIKQREDEAAAAAAAAEQTRNDANLATNEPTTLRVN